MAAYERKPTTRRNLTITTVVVVVLSAVAVFLINGSVGTLVISRTTLVNSPQPILLTNSDTAVLARRAHSDGVVTYTLSGLPETIVPDPLNRLLVYVVTDVDQVGPNTTRGATALVRLNLNTGAVSTVTTHMLTTGLDFVVDATGTTGYLVSSPPVPQYRPATWRGTGEVEKIDLTTGVVLDTLTVPQQPAALVLTSDGRRALLASGATQSVYPIDVTSMQLGTPIDLTPPPISTILDPLPLDALVATGTDQALATTSSMQDNVTSTISRLTYPPSGPVSVIPYHIDEYAQHLTGTPGQDLAYAVGVDANGDTHHIWDLNPTPTPVASMQPTDSVNATAVDPATGDLYLLIHRPGLAAAANTTLCVRTPTDAVLTNCIPWNITALPNNLAVIPARTHP